MEAPWVEMRKAASRTRSAKKPADAKKGAAAERPKKAPSDAQAGTARDEGFFRPVESGEEEASVVLMLAMLGRNTASVLLAWAVVEHLE